MNLINRFILKYFVRYVNPQAYWDYRWRHEQGEKGDWKAHEKFIQERMALTGCESVLEVGCGYGLVRGLPGYLGLDFSFEVLKRSELENFLYADFSKRIPLPDDSFDCVLSANVFLHVPPERVEQAVKEVCRVAKKTVILVETQSQADSMHCFSHDLKDLFLKHFRGHIFLGDEKIQ